MFSFEHPEYFSLLWAAPIAVLIWLSYLWWRRRTLSRLVAPSAQERVLPGWSAGRFWLKNTLLLAAMVLLVIAVANPRRGMRQQVGEQRSADVLLVLDISQSMLAQDVPPNRLERAKIFARQLVRALAGERIGLVFFAGSAYAAMPLTTDYEAADMLLRAAAPDLISTQGSDIGAALRVAARRFDSTPGVGRAIVLISDGEDHEGAISKAIAQLRDAGIIAFCTGVGASEGAPIPLGNGEYKRNAEGQIILTRANEATLRQIATATRGEYYRVEQGEAALRAIRREIAQLERRAVQTRSFTEFESYYMWFALPAFLLLTLYAALSWRVHKTVALLLVAGLLQLPLQAQSARDWMRQGDTYYAEGRYNEAEQAYRKAVQKAPADAQALYNHGNALYKQGKYAEAQQAWEKALPIAATPAQKADTWHNIGNALAQQGNMPAAIRAYENSLRLRPGDPDTQTNLQLARKKMQQNQPKPQEQQPSEGNGASASADSMPQPPSTTPQQPQPQTPQQGKLTPEEARQLLETTVAPQDQNSGRKYREQTPDKHQIRPKKDW
ncbi:MAG: VWA domain-containing protein [Saprospiraceae bacterium]|nr:VWA domain-containing protein [Saprospiraceae bacterium]MDW8228254.1 VWA domain-containing protein [Saprospiraceae bacterium]